MSNDVDITIRTDATWLKSFWLVDGNQPVDLTAKHVELRILPTFDYKAGPIRVLSDTSGEITIDNVATGAVSITLSQANLEAHVPPGVWRYFLRVLNGPSDTIEYQRGRLIVLAGTTS